MGITIDYTADFNRDGAFFAPRASFDQSQWLGAKGWYFYGRRSKQDLADKLRAAGLAINTRWLPASKRGVVAETARAEGVELTDRARQALGGADEAAEASRAVDAADLDLPAPEGLAYRPYQRGGVAAALAAWGRGQRGVILGDEMGLGKTMQAIGCMAYADLGRVLVVAPASTLRNWRREIERWWPAAGGAVQVLEGREAIDPSARVVVLNYEKVTGKAGKATAEALQAARWDLVVLDEAQRIKNSRSQRTKVFVGSYNRQTRTRSPGVCDQADRVLVLTGTPLQNRPAEMVPLLEAVGGFGPQGVARHPGAFLKRYCDAGYNAWSGGQDYSGAKNLTELQAQLRAGWMVRRLKADVARELPAKVRQVVPLNGELSRRAKALEEKHLGADQVARVKAALERDGLGAVSALTGQTAAFEALSALRAELAGLKRYAARAYVDDLLEGDAERKVLVFAHHQVLVNDLARHYGDRAICIDGQTPPADRQALVDQFQNDPAVRVAVLSTHAAGEGITLTAADTCVFAEADWNPSWLQQAEDRAHRIGQTAEAVTAHYLVFDETLDAHVLRTAKDKMDIADRALDSEAAAGPAPADREAAPADGPAASTPAAERTVTIKARGEAAAEEYAITADRKAAAAEALLRLAGRCDGARRKDDTGFNGRDAGSDFVQSLVYCAMDGGEALSDKQAAWALRILRTYRDTQLADLKGRLFPEEEVAP